MRICRFDDNRVGIVSGESIRDVTAVLDGLPQVTYPLPRHDPFNDHEVELAVVIGRKARNVSAAEAPGCIAG